LLILPFLFHLFLFLLLFLDYFPIVLLEEDKVINEITALVNNGYKEIVLTGIHTGSYGIDLGIKFSDLIEKLLNIPGLERLRISSIEITELDEKFFKLLKNEKLCNHLHVPLQSGSENVLKLMNRKYNKEEYKKIIDKIRSIRKDTNFTTDVIVSFCILYLKIGSSDLNSIF